MDIFHGGKIDESYQENPIRFAKIKNNEYVVDFKYPFSFFQALGVCLARLY